MKRIAVIIGFFLFIALPAYAFAQTAEIIDLKGVVWVKDKPSADWRKADIGMALDRQAEVRTEKESSCTIAFDKERSNILTLKEDSLIKIEKVIPGNINLTQGRVFILINNLKKAEEFEVRTPTAIAGARGTGWISGFQAGQAMFSCFQNVIYVRGLDNSGKVTSQQNLSSGFSVTVGGGGLFGATSTLGDDDYEQWGDFFNEAAGGGGPAGTGAGDNIGDLMGDDPTGGEALLNDMKQQQADIIKDTLSEGLRQENEAGSGSGSGNPETPEQR